MKWVPSDTFTLETTASLPSLLEVLQAQVEPRKIIRWGFSREHKVFEGQVSESGFNISRIIHYRNSFRPNLVGRFEPGPAGTTIQVVQQLPSFVLLFGLLWAGVALQFFIIVFQGFMGAEEGGLELLPFLFAPLGLMAILYIGANVAFMFEANKARTALEEVLRPYLREKQVA